MRTPLAETDCPGAIEFQAESPDEAALVAAAHVYGYVLLGRTHEWYVIPYRAATISWMFCSPTIFGNKVCVQL